MTSCVRILSTTSVEGPSPSLLLVNPDGTKVLVNCGEGAQRLMLEHQQRLSTVVTVCCPVLRHSSIMGLPGWILTSGDVLGLKNSNHANMNANDLPRDDDKSEEQGGGSAATTTTTNRNGDHSRPEEPPLLDVYGPHGMREFVKSLRHFMKPRGQPKQHQHHHQHTPAPPNESGGEGGEGGNPFGNVRVWEGETAKATSKINSSNSNKNDSRKSGSNPNNHSCGFDRYEIRCYAFDDDEDDNDGGSDGSPNGGGDEAPPRANHKRLYSQVASPNNDESINCIREEVEEEGSIDKEGRRHPPRQRRKQKQQLSFLFTSPPLPGTFLPDEAAKLGVPKGPLWGLLKAGQSVTFSPTGNISKANKNKNRRRSNNNNNNNNNNETSADTTGARAATPAAVASASAVAATAAEVATPAGTLTVHPWQVVSPDAPGVAVLVLHYDTRQRLEQMVRSKDFRDLARRTDGDNSNNHHNSTIEPWRLEVVVHMTPDPDWADEVVQEFSPCSYNNNTEHVWLSTEPPLASQPGAGDAPDTREDYGTPFRAAALGAATRNVVNGSVYLSPMGTTATTETTPKAVSHEANEESSGNDNGRSVPSDGAVQPSPAEDHGRPRFVTGRTMMEFVLIPRAKRGWARALSPSPAVHDAPSLDSASRWIYDQARDNLREVIDVGTCLPSAAAATATEASEELGELYFTGTGSAIPCKHRNVTGMCVTATNGNRMLLDVGEGTVGHLLRSAAVALGDDAGSLPAGRTAARLATIRAVWISHSHADHHLGLLRLLQERRPSNNDDPVLLIAPACIFHFLETCEEIGLLGDGSESTDGSPLSRSPRYRPVNCWDLVTPPGGVPRSDRRSEVCSLLANTFGWTDIQAVPVDHCPNAFAVVLDGTPFGRLVYSGDCRPSKRLADVASPADVLVHEATFEDGMEDEAKRKMHSTVGEALRVGEEMNASCVVLTHFSQRYPRIPPMTLSPGAAAAACSSAPNAKAPPTVVFAFDYMRLMPSNLVEASQLTDVLRLLYPTDEKVEA